MSDPHAEIPTLADAITWFFPEGTALWSPYLAERDPESPLTVLDQRHLEILASLYSMEDGVAQ